MRKIVDMEMFNDKWAPEVIRNITETTYDDMELEKVDAPVFVHFYKSVNGYINKCLISVNSYRLCFSIEQDYLEDMDFEDFLSFLQDEIIHELKTQWWDKTTKIFLHSISLRKSISPVSAFPMITALLRLAILPEEMCLMTKKGVDKFLNRFGINAFLKKYEPILRTNYFACDYIKETHREYRDKIKLWQTLHGIQNKV